MAKVIQGNIPEKITYKCFEEADVNIGNKWGYDYNNHPKTKVTIVEVFDSKEVNTTTPPSKAQTKISLIEVDNTPIKDIKVISYDIYNKQYKALVDNYYVNLSSEVLLDVAMDKGIASGGILKGNFIWAKIGKHLQLIRQNSALHKEVKEYIERKKLKPFHKKNMEIGGVYQDLKKRQVVFLGFVNTARMHNASKPNYYNRGPYTFNYTTTHIKKGMLFCDYATFKKLDKTHLYEKHKWDFDVRKTSSVIEKIGNVIVPDNFIEMLRKSATNYVKDQIVLYSKQQNQGYTLDYAVEGSSLYLNLYPFSKTPIEIFDLQQFLTFM